MQSVRIEASIEGADPGETFDRVVAFERYPDLVEAVQKVTVDRSGEVDRPLSDWEVTFRHGLLRWREEDRLDRADGVVDFEQVSGDFDVFRGRWALTPTASGTDLLFEASFDFGVPSLESIIDPVAVRVLTETIQGTVAGLFPGQVEFRGVTSSLDRAESLQAAR